ncbi:MULTISPECIES: type II toxin-antitoxin system VapC family toxin [unclassified Saccharothrix]|uniref:type II toxin-antitoxin system VapC family toxin n=1 Tax=unclassified Saccharothrix TaxID=2593673 RepID=UPI00307EF6E9
MASDYVVDAGAALEALTGETSAGMVLRTRITESICHAPHLIDAEVGDVLRRAVIHGVVTEKAARTNLSVLSGLIDHRYPHAGVVAARAWELRDTVRFYDALYVALATMLGVPLLTTDVKLSKAPGLPCSVELVG